MPLSQMECCKCHGKFPVRRQSGLKRKRDHIKTMWLGIQKHPPPREEQVHEVLLPLAGHLRGLAHADVAVRVGDGRLLDTPSSGWQPT